MKSRLLRCSTGGHVHLAGDQRHVVMRLNWIVAPTVRVLGVLWPVSSPDKKGSAIKWLVDLGVSKHWERWVIFSNVYEERYEKDLPRMG